jgi:glutamate-1-semialdehyde aminotransferase
MQMKPYGIATERLAELHKREDAAFSDRTQASNALNTRARKVMPNGVPMQWMTGLYRHPPMMVKNGEAAWFEDVDGNRYLDMNLADYAGSLGFNCPPVTQAIARRAEQGMSFLLPGEDAVVCAELLSTRTGLPYWQFAGAASTANVEAMRIARLATGREHILFFGGRYHGHIDETLVQTSNQTAELAAMGLPKDAGGTSHVIPFNDLECLADALKTHDIACVIAEPMLTNCNLVFPDEDFWPAARALIRDAASLLIIDEAHTHNFAYGGLTAAWQIDPDMMIIGKGMGTGIPFALYGLSDALGRLVEHHLDVDVAAPVGIALGGTTYGSALVTAVARAALEKALGPQDYDRTATLGSKLANGLEALFARHGLDWHAPRIGGRAGWNLSSQAPRNADEAQASLDPDFVDTRRVFMANRGVWEAISSAGPSVSFAHEASDIDHYLAVSAQFLDACHG